jgi:hypothetical protein
VMVAAPAARRLEGPPAGDDRSGGHELVDDLAVDAVVRSDRLAALRETLPFRLGGK